MSEGSSGSEPEDGQPAQEPWVARSNWVSEALGNEWLEVEPGIFQQIAADAPVSPVRPATDADAQSVDQTLREALEALTLNMTEAETAKASRSSRPSAGTETDGQQAR
jgi:hypothetical protein